MKPSLRRFSPRASLLVTLLVMVGCTYQSCPAAVPSTATGDNDSEFTGEAPKPPKIVTTTSSATNAAPKKATPPAKPKVAKKPAPKPVPPPVAPPPKEEAVATQPTPVPVPVDPPPKVVPAATLPPPAPVAEPAKPEPVAAQPPPPVVPEPVAAQPPPPAVPEPVAAQPPPPAIPAPIEPTKSTEDISPADQEEVVVLSTSLGDIIIALDTPAAPRTCKNFRNLVKQGFYDRTVFHRVIPNFMIQGGDPNSKGMNRSSYGQGGPGFTIPAEILLKHNKGAVAMARLPDSVNPERESNGSQFYICVADCPSLDDNYTVFGHVLKGMDVVDKIANLPRDARDNPTKRIEMNAHLMPRSKVAPSE